MNYRYLYRAKRKKDGEWVEGAYYIEPYTDKCFIIQWNSTGLGFNEFIEVDGESVCQCTELKDKNGKLIWENDIVKPFSDLKGIVRFGERDYSREFGFYIEWMSKSCYRKDFLYWAEKCEVIGSAIDNPELLEVNYEQSSINNGYAEEM